MMTDDEFVAADAKFRELMKDATITVGLKVDLILWLLQEAEGHPEIERLQRVAKACALGAQKFYDGNPGFQEFIREVDRRDKEDAKQAAVALADELKEAFGTVVGVAIYDAETDELTFIDQER